MPWFADLSDRLRRVRVACGDWTRVTGDSVTTGHGTTAIFLDPPYSDAAGRTADLYAEDSGTVAVDARIWAIEAGRDPNTRIAFCGYEGEHDFPGWDCVAWKTAGGYGRLGNGLGRENAGRERIWFSPACIPATQRDLFSAPPDPEADRMEAAWAEPEA